MFSKVWPTSETYKYFKFLDEVSYGEKLMGELHVIYVLSGLNKHLLFLDAYEYYYGEYRNEGQELIR